MTSLPIADHAFDFSGGRLAALRCSPATDTHRRGSVVLVGGFLGSKEDFVPLLPLLAQAGYDAYSYDHRGQYESDGPTSPDAYTIESLGEDLRGVLAQLKEHSHTIHVVGLCMGGFVAQAAAVTGAEASLALVSCPLTVTRWMSIRLRLLALVGQLIGPTRTVRLVTQNWEKSRPHEALDPAIRPVAQARLTSTQPAHYVGLVRSWAATSRSCGSAASDLPLLVVSGEKDSLFSSHYYTEAARRLGASHAVIADAGHSVQQHQPHAVTQCLLEFWNSIPTTSAQLPRPVREASYVPSDRKAMAAPGRREGYR
ncbi:alpha/beta fold hydrolase [Streptomyces katrae]|uniref:alpha/beta fold hydrolase n=1 Tax=Streptomyces katrae TaxID=68223 RepID=UPI0004BE7F72|nr:alpha/beta fold hydrolase [Streptomyces katrae]